MKTLTRRCCLFSVFICVQPWLMNVALAQPYPTKPVRIIVPFAPGGGLDTIARLLSQRLTDSWGQAVIVENRPGAGGQIGIESVLKAPADGYTLGIGTISTLAIAPATQLKPRYDPIRDFAHVTLISTVPYVMVAHPALPAPTLAQFVRLARARPGELSYGSAGHATGTHLTAEYFSSVAGIKMIHVPYKGDAPALIDLMAGQITTGFFTMIISATHIRGGKLRGLAVMSRERSRELPNVPTAIESGYAGFSAESWQGISLRAGVAPDISRKLNTDLVRILNTPQVRNSIEAQGNSVNPGTPQDFERFITDEIAKWKKVIADAGIRIE
ncbi:MAG: tripartite tricarboxylate transporter substrate binding protein [Betaproteobacteria bacterium]|nr:tripartite tricarboxylate transporter substrate binding protein [Betaproteobacteria bacterium]